tara:strand:+ start:1116 stop:1850 length:735 start_codon:yes stop_codon:yes gene_type:complete
MSTVYAESTGNWDDMYGAEADATTATARNNTNYQFANALIPSLLCQHSVAFGSTYIYRSFLSFDLSGQSGTCTEAVLSLRFNVDVTSGFVTSKGTTIYVCKVNTSESGFLTSGIYNDLDGWVSSGSYDGNVPNYGTMAKSGTSAETVTLTLNSDGLSAVNSAVGSGRFQIALLTSDDYLSNIGTDGLGDPDGYSGTIQTEGVSIASMENTTASNRPQLELTLEVEEGEEADWSTFNATFFGSNF